MGPFGATAVARACRAGHLTVLEALLQTPSCDPNIANDKMQSPLHFAAFKRNPKIVSALLANDRCNPFVIDRKGRTAAEDTSDEEIRVEITAAQEALLRSLPNGEMHI